MKRLNDLGCACLESADVSIQDTLVQWVTTHESISDRIIIDPAKMYLKYSMPPPYACDENDRNEIAASLRVALVTGAGDLTAQTGDDL